jgi:hypothetical protein
MANLRDMNDMGLRLRKHCESYVTAEPWCSFPCQYFYREGKPGMGLRLLFIIAIVLGLAPVSASAEGILHRASCSVVRYYVAKYSASMAEAYARSKGATEAEIEAARRCLDGGSRVRTAQDMR